MQQNGFVKTYVRPDSTAVLTCPSCGHQKVILAEPFKGHRHKLKVKCLCKEHFMVFLEFRRRIRKPVHLNGTFCNLTKNGSKCCFIAHDVSTIGITMATVEAPSIEVNDELQVEFSLDDGYETEIRKDVIVKNVRTGAVGGEFDPSLQMASDGVLGNYVMSGCR